MICNRWVRTFQTQSHSQIWFNPFPISRSCLLGSIFSVSESFSFRLKAQTNYFKPGCFHQPLSNYINSFSTTNPLSGITSSSCFHSKDTTTPQSLYQILPCITTSASWNPRNNSSLIRLQVETSLIGSFQVSSFVALRRFVKVDGNCWFLVFLPWRFKKYPANCCTYGQWFLLVTQVSTNRQTCFGCFSSSKHAR